METSANSEREKFDTEFRETNIRFDVDDAGAAQDILNSDHVERFTTSEAAERLNMKPQVLRNWCVKFDPYIDVEKTPSGHRIFTADSLEKIRRIKVVQAENNFKDSDMLEFLESSTGRIFIENKNNIRMLEAAMNAMIEKMDEHIAAAVQKNIAEAFDASKALVDQKNSEEFEQVSTELSQKSMELEQTKDEIAKLKEEKEKAESDLRAQQQKNLDLIEQNKAELERLKNEKETVETQLREQMQKNLELLEKDRKKKGLFGLFG
ncbi:MerR HTH family regulatory protein [Lachnospiraceae bacterium]|nr:MerR HTH family regulatory protein [Lachnospiraceae bacterium]